MSKGTILILEDDADLRSSMIDFLEEEGYKMHSATNGEEGLQRLSEIAVPDIILLDLYMPQMNGWEFHDNIRNNPAYNKIPVIGLTASSSRTQGPTGVEVLKKPIDVSVLLDTIEKYLRIKNG